MKIKLFLWVILIFASALVFGQDTTKIYKKRVLETTEIDFLTSYYAQDGDNAAVTGGIGTEELTDITATFVVSIPLNDDDVLTIDAGISAYTSASSSNVDALNGPNESGPFQASTGASGSDSWKNLTGIYSHSSDDRNKIWSTKISLSTEYDYFSAGFGGSYTQLFNEKNTSLSISGNIFIDTWNAIYPSELRSFADEKDGSVANYVITGNQNYQPNFKEFSNEGRNSYSLGLGFSQILHKKLQGSLAIDLIKQQGLLSTPFQRVYFSDIEDSFIDNFHLADDIERLPDNRLKVALGGRLNWYINERLVVKAFLRYFSDDWGISSLTASIELPIKISTKFTLYPSYRYYDQTAADYFAPYNKHLSTEQFYTSDYDLSKYSANQFGFGVSYTDIFTKARLGKFGLKSIDIKFYQYDRNASFSSSIITAGVKFVMD